MPKVNPEQIASAGCAAKEKEKITSRADFWSVCVLGIGCW